MLNDQFGYSVSISGDTVVVGSRFADSPSLNQIGAVYVFMENAGGAGQWGFTQKLVASDAIAGDRLGTAVSIDGNQIVAGAPFRDDFGDKAGKAYLFVRPTGSDPFVETQHLHNPETTTRDEFGIGVAVDASNAVVGSWLDNRPQNNSGAAYLFGF